MSRVRWLLSSRRQHDDLAREMKAHVAERVDHLVSEGMTHADARIRAHREFGNLTRHIEDCGELWRWRPLYLLGGSLRDASRTFRRGALTIGACLLVLGTSTGLFATAAVIADTLLLRPIRLPGIDRVVAIGGLADPGLGWTFEDWWGQAASLEQFSAWSAGVTQLETGEGRFLVNAAYVDSRFPDLFRATPIVGRALGPGDFVPASVVPVVISEATWKSRFKHEPEVIGSMTTLSAVPVVIVGVLPTLAAYPHDVQIWVPRPAAAPFSVARQTGYGVNARLTDGATVEDARKDIQLLGSRLNDEHGARTGVTYFGTFRLDTVSDRQARPLRVPVIALLIGALAVLVMAAANTATLLLNLVVDRRHELAVRASLGATRRRLIGQVGLESVVIGSVSGLMGGVSGMALLVASRPLLAPVSAYLSSDRALWSTLQAGVGLGTLLGLLVGLAPLALSLAWRDWSLLAHRAADRGSRRGRRLRTTLVVVQVTAAMMLVTVAGAAIKAFLVSNRTTFGFDAERVLAVRLVMPAASPAVATVEAITDNARASGVVETSAGTDRLPVVDSGGMLYIGPQNTSPTRILSIQPGFMRTMGIPLLAGREFEPGDTASVVISDTLARRFFSDRSALGQMLQVSPKDRREVIGIVGDIQEDIHADTRSAPGTGGALLYSLLPRMGEAEAGSLQQTATLVMRCRDLCEDVVQRVRTIIESSGATVVDITSLQSALNERAAPSQLRSVIAVGGGGFGLLLALTAVYGIVRQVATSRVQEVNIRMALGSTPSEARAIVIRYAALIVFIGVSLGGGLGWLMLSAGQTLFYGVSPSDPAGYIAAGLTMVVGGVLACLGPALRLGRLDSRQLLRD